MSSPNQQRPNKSPLPAPPRVSGGLVVSIGKNIHTRSNRHKSKTKKSNTTPAKTTEGPVVTNAADVPHLKSSSSSSSGIPSILTRDPSRGANDHGSSSATCNTVKRKSRDKEFEFDDDDDDDPFEFDDCASLSDVLLCLRSYTRPTATSPEGGMSENCAYCPIVAISWKGHDTASLSSTHAAPFLSRRVLCHVMAVSDEEGRSRTEDVERELKRLLLENRIRLLQLHGTAVAGSSNGGWNDGGGGWRGDGNDDDDVAVMETSVYERAAEMALETYYQCSIRKNDGRTTTNDDYLREVGHWPALTEGRTVALSPRMDKLFRWFANEILPHFAGKTWISSLALQSFHDELVKTSSSGNEGMRRKRKRETTCNADENVGVRYTSTEINQMLQDLVHAGVLLPRRGLGCNGGEGYWFSLPGLGHAAKSIVEGRISIFRRIRQSKYKERKRTVLEREIGRDGPAAKEKGSFNDDHTGGDLDGWTRSKGGTGKKKCSIRQSGKYLVLDALAMGWVTIHETCNGEQFVRLL